MNKQAGSTNYLVPISIVAVLVGVFFLMTLTTNVSAQSATNLIPENQTQNLNNRTQLRVRLKDLRDQSDKALSAEQKTALIERFKGLSDRIRCELRQRNIGARIEYYDLARSEQSNALRSVIQNLQTASERLKRLDLDPAKLNAHIAELTKFSDQARNAYFILDDSLAKLAQIICDIKAVNFPEINAAAGQLGLIRDLNEKIKTYLTTKLEPDLKADFAAKAAVTK